uniref:Disease resistance protein n=1 Tax=Quercus lobata TaxID=97700 RepID=A0A7N2MG31_QUELO
MNIQDVDKGILLIKHIMCHKRVLLVLDDVNQLNQLEKLARELNWFGPVHKDHPQELGQWSRLWIYKDIHNVLVKNSGTRANQGLVLQLPKVEKLHKYEMRYWNLEAFSKMPNLKLLIIHGVQLLHGPKHLSNKLRILDWSMYPSKSLPSNFQPYELVELQLLHIVKLNSFGKGQSIWTS